MQLSSEAMYYNVLALQLQCNYEKLARIYRDMGSWEAAWNRIGTLFPLDPHREAARLNDASIHLALSSEPTFPPLLREIPLPPHAIYYKGSIPSANNLTLAVVGTRKPTSEGLLCAERISESLAHHHIPIVSGLALGIDGAAHTGTLRAKGTAIAVLAHGLHTVQPTRHERLAEDILKTGGALISEYPIGTPALKSNFIARNRIVSGLAQGILIIEAPRRSGSLLTARFANEQGRTVMVIPGPANHPHFHGSHALIREGATLVENTEQIFEELGFHPEILHEPTLQTSEIDSDTQRILLLVTTSTHPLTIDKISEATNLKVQTVLQIITRLVIANKIQETQNGISSI